MTKREIIAKARGLIDAVEEPGKEMLKLEHAFDLSADNQDMRDEYNSSLVALFNALDYYTQVIDAYEDGRAV